ncbi:CHAP domain-containing protein [Swaminathania salitolerans]|uniref:Peptidase C51 domain-containing protein n=1 Tax=Swaminathania salitolerans TaxID=182838 RepID=A0A511BKK0_9PROT|nr:CHAP domain-containing protein [Swaminathania salitolerans]GBQ09658.1 hypothetical protein AA21291_0153 [Swaminathania salitolerans LMG 21291]GEL00890.1 hypothetical protein SSA02_00530 [Swaminathania salitolerans]
MKRAVIGFGLCLGLAACGGGPREYSRASFNGPLQCAPYARAKTGVALYGAAAGWWRSASGKYRKTARPAKGEILVFRSTGRLPSGHVSVVRRIVSSRKILVEHANWEPGRIDRSAPVIDVSRRNDWSLVRVYWAPIKGIGSRAYPTYGFIVPRDLDDIARLQETPDHAM